MCLLFAREVLALSAIFYRTVDLVCDWLEATYTVHDALQVYGTHGGSPTPNLTGRNGLLYAVELRGREW